MFLQFMEAAKQFLIIKSLKNKTKKTVFFLCRMTQTSELYIDCDTVSSTLSNLFLIIFLLNFEELLQRLHPPHY